MPAYELPWSGRPFESPVLALDTETAVVDESGREYDLRVEVPPMVLATVSDGTRHAVLTSDQISPFLGRHSRTLFVGFNFAFDFWVVLKAIEDSVFRAAWWASLPDRNLVDDVMLLDFLVRLGSTKGMAEAGYRNLGEVAREIGMEANKESPYRLRFHELMGRDWATVDRGFFAYAIQDTIVTWWAYKHLSERAREIAAGAGVSQEMIERHGLLTSKLQTRAAIVLAQVGRNGMGVDAEKVARLRHRLEEEISGLVRDLSVLDPPVFATYRAKKRLGQLKTNAGTGVPKIVYQNLRYHLCRIASERGINPDYLPRTPKSRQVATKLESWRSLAGDHPVVQSWGRLMDLAKALQFLVQFSDQKSVHPSFYPLVRTGRTSCRGPNLQQMPRESWFREIFVSRPGYSFVIVDYSAIEIVTLAAVLLNRYGRSTLADVLRSGRRPHDYTAALVLGRPYEEVVAGVKAEKKAIQDAKAASLPLPPTPFTEARQAAKAINFGVPGGLGAKKLAVYAKTNYGVDMDETAAKTLREQLVTKIYPELSRYLDEDAYEALSQNLGCSVADLDRLFDTTAERERRLIGRLIDNVVGGGSKRKDGTMYSHSFRSLVWRGLQGLNKNPDLEPLLQTWEPNMQVRLALTAQSVTTLTGRVRTGADYGEARNTPFQGLAADGAKVALWEIHRAGFSIAHYVHDEIVVEVEDDRAEQALRDVSRIMIESMSSVLQCDLPVEVEGVISKCWVK